MLVNIYVHNITLRLRLRYVNKDTNYETFPRIACCVNNAAIKHKKPLKT